MWWGLAGLVFFLAVIPLASQVDHAHDSANWSMLLGAAIVGMIACWGIAIAQNY